MSAHLEQARKELSRSDYYSAIDSVIEYLESLERRRRRRRKRKAV